MNIMTMALPSYMIHRLVGMAALWLVWKSCQTAMHVLFSLQALSILVLAAASLAAAIRYKARPLTKRGDFVPHMKPMTQERRSECIKDLEAIGNQEGLDKLWNAARQGKETTVLLTGVTGYVGRALLLQLLRRIQLAEGTNKNNKTKIILIARPDKKGGTAVDRVEGLRQEAIFSEIPNALWDSVVSVVETRSLSEPDLGCSNAALRQLRNANITHIVHSAADVRFESDLGDLAASNISSALQLQAFARGCSSCERMIFLSTAFVNPANGTLDDPLPEALVDLAGYDAQGLYHSMLGDQVKAREVMKELGFHNNYTFSKCVAEHLLSRDKSKELCIVRPGIVGPAFVLPEPGWNGNSPTTVTAYLVMWTSRLIRANRFNNQPFPVIPVDVVAVGVVNAMLQPLTTQAASNQSMFTTCGLKNLVWDAHSKIKFIPADKLIWSATAFGVFAGHLSTTEAALCYALIDVANAYPRWSGVLHDVFNKGPLQLLHLLQVALKRVGVKLAPGFAAAKMLKFVKLATLYAPFTGDSYHFQSSLHIPASFDVDRYVADQHKTVHNFICDMGSRKKSQEAGSNEKRKLNQLRIAPKGRSDLWWAVTQPNGNVAVRVVCFFASKVIRAVYGDIVLDLETTAAAMEGLSNTEGSSRLVLAPTFRSLMDVILVLYITFAFPSLGIDIPYVVADKLFEDKMLSFLSRWAQMIWLDPSIAPRKSLQSVADHSRPIALFLEGTPSYDRRQGQPRTTMLRALQASQTHSKHVVIPMCLEYDRIIERDTAEVQLTQGSVPSLNWSGVLASIGDVFAGKKKRELGCARVSFGQPYEMNKTSNVAEACGCIQEVQRSLSCVTSLHLEVAQSHLGVTKELLHSAIEELGGTVVLHKSSKQQCQVSSIEEKWCLHMQWMHHFAPHVYKTHPSWASWLMGGNVDARTAVLDTELTLDVTTVVAILRKVFDTADFLAAQTDVNLRNKGITAMSTLHLAREMKAEKSSSIDFLSSPIIKAAASFVVSRRLEADAGLAATGPVTPVFASAQKTSESDHRFQKVVETLLAVDLSAFEIGITSPRATAVSSSSTVQSTLLATSLTSDQVCVWDESFNLGAKRCPDFVVYPASENQCVELTDVAKQNDICLIPGSGSDLDAGELCPSTEEDSRPIVLVDLRRMDKVLWLNKEAGLVCVEAGMAGKDLEDELSKHGLAVHRQLAECSAIGDYIAEWATSMDHNALVNLKGVRVVTGNGAMGSERSACAGGSSLGLTGLAIGSEGRLGMITTATVHVMRQSDFTERRETLVFPNFNSGLGFLREVAKLSPGLGPSSARLIDSPQCMISRKMGVVGNEQIGESSIMKKLNDAYVFQWKGVDRRSMSSCEVVFEGASGEISVQKQLLDHIVNRHNGVRSFTIGDNKVITDRSMPSLRNRGVHWTSFKAFVPWSRCSDMCRQVKHDVMRAHREQSLPGDPYVSHSIVQYNQQGGVIEFGLAMCLQGVCEPSLVFASITDRARESCMRHGSNFLSERLPEEFKQTFDPCNVFGRSYRQPSPSTEQTELTTLVADGKPEDSEATGQSEAHSSVEIQDAFDRAINHIKSSGSSYALSDSQKLKLYALYKYATEGPCPPDQRPSIFDPVGRKKYDAWSQIELHVRSEDAMKSYVSSVEAISGISMSPSTEQPEPPLVEDGTKVDSEAACESEANSALDIQEAFDHAVNHIKSCGSSYALSDSQKLDLYSLYKHATEGPCPPDQRPSIFNPVGRKKYDAWSRIESHVSSEDAMKRYVSSVEEISCISMTANLHGSPAKKETYPVRNRQSSVSSVPSMPSVEATECSESSESSEHPLPEVYPVLNRSSVSSVLSLPSMLVESNDENNDSDTSESDLALPKQQQMLCSTTAGADSNYPKIHFESMLKERIGPESAGTYCAKPIDSKSTQENANVTKTETPGEAHKSFPFLPPRWYIFPLLGCLAYVISSYSLWQYASVFYAITWTICPFGNWRIAFQLVKRSLLAPYGNLPLRFNLVGIAFLSWLTFVRFPFETLLWYLDELFFSDYNRTAIKEPLFLLGQPRSGTTKFQDVLSEDKDAFCSMYLYEMRFPYLTVQYLVDFLSKIDKHCLNGQGYKLAERAGLMYVLPEVGERKAMRRLRYDLPDEDDTLFLFHSLCHFALTGMFPSARTAKSLHQISDLPEETRRRMMEFHQKAVRKVLYRRGHGRRYLAKWVAGWNGLLEEAKTVYPDAKYVAIVRSPSEQLPSWMKLQGLLSEQIAGHNFMKLPEVRKAVININAQWHQTQIQFCQETPKQSMFIVGFDEFVKDIPQQVSRVYDFLGQKIVPGSRFHESLLAAHRKQATHKKTVVRADEQFISTKEISREFPRLSLKQSGSRFR